MLWRPQALRGAGPQVSRHALSQVKDVSSVVTNLLAFSLTRTCVHSSVLRSTKPEEMLSTDVSSKPNRLVELNHFCASGHDEPFRSDGRDHRAIAAVVDSDALKRRFVQGAVPNAR